ncbi:adenylate/guanylate cyclase domain-containing protein, partial [Thermodesulfobacteriota bacterium]
MNQERTKRKLSGILSADVVGYSLLMEEDETRTIQNLEESKKLIGELIEEYKGRVVDAPGDNLLAEFNSVVNAVDCAVKIQSRLKNKNFYLPENNRMVFRIGVNLGDVIEEDGRIYGDGINIAARIEGLAEPGGICLSKTAYDHVKTKLDLGYEYLGEHNLKNITEPVSVYRVLTGSKTAGKVIGEKRYLGRITRRVALALIIFLFAAAAGSTGWIIYSEYSKKVEQASPDRMAYPLPDKPSLVVLPFVNLSGKPEQDYFSDGLTDEIISGLSKNPDLFVIARNSSFVYKDKPVKIKQVSEDLGVRYILEGSVRRDGDRVKITATLIDAIKGYLIWSETYDRKMEDIFELQSEIMWQIFRELRIKLVRRNRPPDYLPVKKVSVEYTETFYLLYRYYKERTPGRLETAKQLADKLISIAPDPWVYYMRGSILIALSGPRGSKSGEIFLTAAEEDAREVEKLDKGASYGLFGQIYLAKDEIQKALTSYEKWVEFSPNSANAHFGIGFIHILLKRYDEAIKHYEAGLRIDPFPESQQFT